jgi:hypothetical protein
MLQGFPIKLAAANPQWMDSNNDPPPANPIFHPRTPSSWLLIGHTIKGPSSRDPIAQSLLAFGQAMAIGSEERAPDLSKVNLRFVLYLHLKVT